MNSSLLALQNVAVGIGSIGDGDWSAVVGQGALLLRDVAAWIESPTW